MTVTRVVVVGAGHAGVQAAASLRDGGFEGSVTLLTEEDVLPYQRPPLSKTYLSGADDEPQGLRGNGFYPRAAIDLRLGARVARLDRDQRTLRLTDGTDVAYDQLVLATGSRPRSLPMTLDIDGVHYLRTLEDSSTLRQALSAAERLAVVGGGFLGLEVASVAAAADKTVTVVEAAPTLMARAVSHPTSRAMAERHGAAGVRLVLGEELAEVSASAGALCGLTTNAGTELEADLVLVAVGAMPNDDLAREAGLATEHGVLVDATLRTTDPAIWAVGDCARVSQEGESRRLESVQNATDQGRHAAAGVLGDVRPYASVPWFWSDQTVAKLQIAGLYGGEEASVVRGDVHNGQFSVLHFAGDRLTCVESLGRPGDHIAARRLLAAGATISPTDAADPDVDLRALARS